jgi:hypothetical protein
VPPEVRDQRAKHRVCEDAQTAELDQNRGVADVGDAARGDAFAIVAGRRAARITPAG